MQSGRVAGSPVAGCAPRKKLPVLNMWSRSRKDSNREVHALNGNTSSAGTAYPCEPARKRVAVDETAKEDFIEPLADTRSWRRLFVTNEVFDET